jgi:hypothetical protein
MSQFLKVVFVCLLALITIFNLTVFAEDKLQANDSKIYTDENLEVTLNKIPLKDLYPEQTEYKLTFKNISAEQININGDVFNRYPKKLLAKRINNKLESLGFKKGSLGDSFSVMGRFAKTMQNQIVEDGPFIFELKPQEVKAIYFLLDTEALIQLSNVGISGKASYKFTKENIVPYIATEYTLGNTKKFFAHNIKEEIAQAIFHDKSLCELAFIDGEIQKDKKAGVYAIDSSLTEMQPLNLVISETKNYSAGLIGSAKHEIILDGETASTTFKQKGFQLLLVQSACGRPLKQEFVLSHLVVNRGQKKRSSKEIGSEMQFYTWTRQPNEIIYPMPLQLKPGIIDLRMTDPPGYIGSKVVVEPGEYFLRLSGGNEGYDFSVKR